MTNLSKGRGGRHIAGRQLLFCLSLGLVLVGACQGKQRRFVTGPFDDEVDASSGLADEAPAPQASPAPGDAGEASSMESSEALGATPLTPAAPTQGSSGCGDGGACSAPCDGCALLELGELCSSAADCASGFCALATDGVGRCCDQRCTGIDCVRCSVEGRCEGAPTFAAECAEVLCPSDDACRDYDPLIPAGTCSGESACATQADCAFQWTAAARDGAACECAESSCALVDGETCTRDEDCTSGACRASLGADNVCCAQGCGTAEVCSDDGSRCELAPVCTGGQQRCSGSSFQLCTGGQWATQRECGALGCDTSLGGCRRSVGQACSSSSECGEGACRQAANGASICCTAACDAACRVCSNTGTSCQFLPDDAACGTITCPGDSTCRDYPAGVTTNRCRNGSCGSPEAVCTFTARNSGQSCSASLACDGQGNCAVAKKGLGATCSSGAECGSNNCVDGVCCDTACDGPCMECNRGSGLCNVMPADDPEQCAAVNCASNSECFAAQDITTNRCQALGQCKTASQCQQTLLVGAACESTTSAHRRCNSVGACADPTVTCGSASCAIDDDTTCCYRGSAGSVVPVCTSRASCSQQQFQFASPVNCDNVNDCRAGEICCHVSGAASSFSCATPERCVSSPVTSAFQICSTPGPAIGIDPQRFPGFACR